MWKRDKLDKDRMEPKVRGEGPTTLTSDKSCKENSVTINMPSAYLGLVPCLPVRYGQTHGSGCNLGSGSSMPLADFSLVYAGGRQSCLQRTSYCQVGRKWGAC